jgi:uncharacterized membrane protein
MSNLAFTSRQAALIVMISTVGIVLRFAAIDRSYWTDELATVVNVDVPNWTTVVQIASRDNQPPLYNITVFAWTRAFGYSEIAVRSLSVLYGLIALFTPWLARTSLSRNEKLLNFAILCLMSLPIRYAQEARNYSLLFLMSSACLYSYYEMSTASRRSTQVLFHISLILLAFSHLFGLMLAVSFLAVMIWRERRVTWRLGLILYAAALSAAVLVPLLRGGAGQQAGGNFWITFTVGSVSQELLRIFTPVGILLLAYAFAIWRRTLQRVKFNPVLAQSMMPFVLMFSGCLVISLHSPILRSHYLIGLIPAYALLTTWFLQPNVSCSPPIATLVLLFTLALQAVALSFSPFLFVQENLREIAERSIAANSKVCYLVPNGTAERARKYLAFYVLKRFNRPDLEPEMIAESDVPQVPATRGCNLWAEAHLQKRGVSVLKALPQFNRCADVPLGRPGVRMASTLIDCRS